MKGLFGNIHLMITNVKTCGIEYDHETNTYMAEGYDGENFILDVGQIIRVRCLEVIITPGSA